MLLTRLPIFRFSAKKSVSQPGIIIEPDSFKQTGIFPKFLHWFRNIQTYNDMERHLEDFNRKNSHKFFLQHNNKLIQGIRRRNLRDLDMMLSEQYFKKPIKSHIKSGEPLPINFNIFQASSARIVQARSFMDTIVRLKSIDQWYQVVIEYENEEKKQKAYHVLQRFYKQKQWKFIKFNL